jgi:hypothetical protein
LIKKEAVDQTVSEGEFVKQQLNLERPKTYKELIAFLWDIDESKYLPLKNQDGFLYL